MNLNYCSIQIKQLDTPMMDQAQGWSFAEISVEMMDSVTGGYLDVTTKVPVRTDVTQTLAQVRQQAADNSIALLRAVANLLETHGPETLVRMMYEIEKAELTVEGSQRRKPSN